MNGSVWLTECFIVVILGFKRTLCSIYINWRTTKKKDICINRGVKRETVQVCGRSERFFTWLTIRGRQKVNYCAG